MSWLRDTIAGRTVLVLVLGLGSILGLAQYLYQRGLEREVKASHAARTAGQLLLVAESLSALDPGMRDDAAHRMSGGPLELHWAREPLATPGGALDPAAAELRDHLLSQAPRLVTDGLVIGSSRPEHDAHASPKDADHTTLLSLALADGSWLNVTLVRVLPARAASPSLILSAVLGALGVVLIAVLMGRWLTQPLDRLAAGAGGLFLTGINRSLPETGTREVRTLAAAINGLQHRITRLVDDRTQMLAAISHDLRTPLTRLRLRTARLGEDALRRSIEADLDEMESMIDATLSFLRDDGSGEPVDEVDLAAILETIAADAADAGQPVALDIPRALVVSGRHLALKRALTNLVQNALKYAGAAEVLASSDGKRVLVSIRDEGPGLAADEMEAVFAPFYRIEGSRGRGTGGHGLGLTVARSVARAHGGDVTLANRSPHGLEASMVIPCR